MGKAIKNKIDDTGKKKHRLHKLNTIKARWRSLPQL